MNDSNEQHKRNKKQDLEAELIRLRQEICSLKTELRDLRLSEEKFFKAFNENRIASIIYRLEDFVVIEVNDTCLEALGYQREEMIGKSAWELNIWADFTEREEIMNHFSKQGYIRNFECQVRKKSGNILVGMISSGIVDLNGVKCMLTSAVDITERKKMEEALKLANTAFREEQLFKSDF